MRAYIRDKRSPVPLHENVSKVMSSNIAKNTKPEVILRKQLWKLGLEGYRLHYKEAQGRPDIVFLKKKVAIFVNGCYWHRCPRCNLPLPKSNQQFWITKFQRNTERDKSKIDSLKKSGWKVYTVWECEIKKNLENTVDRLSDKLNSVAH